VKGGEGREGRKERRKDGGRRRSGMEW